MAKFLAVDDSELVPAMLERTLARHGNHSVLAARNGREGLEILAKHPDVALIFLDLQMPIMDGFSFLRVFKSLPEPTCSLPVVVLTAQDQTAILKALGMGANAFITKPIRLRELAIAVGKLLSSQQ